MPRQLQNLKNDNNKTPNQQKKSGSTYLIYYSVRKIELLKEKPNLTSHELTQLIAEEWSKMSEQQKLKFQNNKIEIKQEQNFTIKAEQKSLHKSHETQNSQTLKNKKNQKIYDKHQERSEQLENQLSEQDIKQENKQHRLKPDIKQKVLSKNHTKQQEQTDDKDDIQESDHVIPNDTKKRTPKSTHIKVKLEDPERDTIVRSIQKKSVNISKQLAIEPKNIQNSSASKASKNKNSEQSENPTKNSVKKVTQESDRERRSTSLRNSVQKQKQKDKSKIKQSPYYIFYHDVMEDLKKKFPKRTSQELQVAVLLEWKKHKYQKKQQKEQKDKKEKPDKSIAIIHGERVVLPKQPITAYVRFMIDKKKDILDENPTMAMNEVAKEGSRRWKLLSEEDKMPYQTIYEKEMEEYKKQKQQIQTQYGYYPQMQNKNKTPEELEQINLQKQERKKELRKLRLNGQPGKVRIIEENQSTVKTNPFFEMVTRPVSINFSLLDQTS